MARFLTLATVGLLLATATSASAAEWYKITVNAVGDKLYVDRSTIQQKGGLVSYWEYREFPQPNNAFFAEKLERPLHGVVSYWITDCTARSSRMRKAIAYDKDRKKIREFDYGDAAKSVQVSPGSSASKLVDYVCKPQPLQPLKK